MTAAPTLTLTEFLLARLVEDEAVARRIAAVGSCEPAYDPARVLADVEAKRLIVEWDAEQPVDRGVLGILASVYRDHPDYDPDWA